MTKGCLSHVGRTIFRKKLHLSRPWKVADLELLPESGEERIHIVHDGSKPLACPECGRACPCYDHRHRRWRHLDSHGYHSYLVCEVPRVSCPEHGVVTVAVPWADRSGRYTAAFEVLVLDWLRETSVLAVSRQLGLGWKAIDGIKAHLWGIINAVVLKVSNGPAEILNSRIKMLKVKSRGYRNKKRFMTDIYFHLGGLDLYPEGVKR